MIICSNSFQKTCLQGICLRTNGVFEFEQKLLDGRRAGLGSALGAREVEIAIAPESESPSHAWAIVEHPAGKNFVDFDEDLQFKDSECSSGGFDNIELLKRYTLSVWDPAREAFQHECAAYLGAGYGQVAG